MAVFTCYEDLVFHLS